MKNSAKRLLSSFLVIIMLIGIVPFEGMGITASAAETYSGTCGEKLTWMFDDEAGVLTIDGEGDLSDFDIGNADIPESFYNGIELHIGENVTANIGGNWFGSTYGKVSKIVVDSNNNNLCSDDTGVLFDKDKTKLLRYPSYNNRTIFEIPNTVVYIDDYAFCGSLFLKEVVIADSVELIGDGAFEDCDFLENIYIGKNVWALEEAFYGTKNVKNFVVDDDNVTYCSDLNGVLYTKDMKTLIKYPCGRVESEFEIPSAVNCINNSAFEECANLINITIPDSVTAIGSGAFSFCGYYNDISNWEDGVLYIDNHIVATVGYDLCGDYTIKNGTKTIAEYCFNSCSELTKVTIPNSVENLGCGVFWDCEKLTDIFFGGSKAQWFNYTYLPPEDITIHFGNLEEPSGICGDSLGWVLTNESRLVISGLGEMYYYESDLDYPWYCYKTLIEEVVLEDGVASVAGNAFVNYDKLKAVTMGKDVVCVENTAGYSVYWGSDMLESITVSSANKVYSSDSNGVLYNKDKTRIIQYPAGKINTSFTMPESVAEISRSAFYGAENLTDITMSPNISYIGSGAFSGTGMLADNNNWEDGAFYVDKYLIDARVDGDYKVKEGTRLIAEDAFYYNHSVKGITIPESVKYINDSAFFFTSIERIIVDEKNPYYCSGTYGDLYNKDKTELIRYPDANEQNQVIVPDGVKKIVDGAFSWVKCISTVILPDSVEIIEPYTFGYSSLREIILGDGVKTIGESAFDSCGITSITIGENIETIEQYAFCGCVGLTNVYFNGTEKEWNDISIEEGNECLLNATIHFSDEEECDHSYTSKVTIEPTYTAEGEKTYTCEKCGDMYTEVIPKKQDHDGGAIFYLNIVEETSDKVKLEVYLEPCGCVVSNFDLGVFEQSDKVSDCIELEINDIYFLMDGNNVTRLIAGVEVEGEGVTVPHRLALYTFTKRTNENVDIDDFDLVVTNFGSYCCGDYTVIKNLPEDNEPLEHEHKFNHIVIPSTCTVAGMEYDICSGCGGTFNTTVLSLKPHSWSEWKVVREATATLEGLKERMCTVCGTTEEELIPKLNVIFDDESGISIEFNDEYDSGVEIKVEEVFDGDSFQILDLKYGNSQSVVFDITTEKDGVKVQPDGKVKVRIPLPKGFDATKLFVCYVDSTNGTVTNIPAKVANGYVEFETDHFSYYAIVEKLGKVNSVSINDVSMSYKDGGAVAPSISVDSGVKYTVTYSSSNTDVVSVDANGKLTTNGTGSATITVTVTDECGNTVTDTCNVNVSYTWWQWIIVIVLFGWIWY